MAFENVNVNLLKSSVNSLIDSVNYNNSKEIMSKIQNSEVWNTDSRDNLNKSLDKLVNIKYKNLEDKLNKYKEITLLIEKYQKTSKNMAESEALLNDITNQISETSLSYTNYLNGNAKEDVKVDKLKNKIDKLNISKENCKNKLKEYDMNLSKLKSEIESLL